MKKTLTSAVCAGLIAGGTIFGAGISYANPGQAQEQSAQTESQRVADKVVNTALNFHNDERFKALKKKQGLGGDDFERGFDSSGYLTWLYYDADPEKFALGSSLIKEKGTYSKSKIDEPLEQKQDETKKDDKIVLRKMLFEQAEKGKNSANLEIVPLEEGDKAYKNALPGDIIAYKITLDDGSTLDDWVLVLEPGAAKVQYYGANGPKTLNISNINGALTYLDVSGPLKNKETKPVFIMRPSVTLK